MILDSILFESIKISFDTDETLTIRRAVPKHFEEMTIGELTASSKDNEGFYFPIVYEWQKSDGKILSGKFYFYEEMNKRLRETSASKKISDVVKFKDFWKGVFVKEDNDI